MQEHRVFASRLVDVTPEDICLKTTLYRLEEPKGHMGFMTYTDFLTNLERLPLQTTDSVLVTVDGESKCRAPPTPSFLYDIADVSRVLQSCLSKMAAKIP